ncbi:MAG: histidine kinase [Bacteroidia bacterium]|nr:histidine kinase [Bacteroidia bacterium]
MQLRLFLLTYFFIGSSFINAQFNQHDSLVSVYNKTKVKDTSVCKLLSAIIESAQDYEIMKPYLAAYREIVFKHITYNNYKQDDKKPFVNYFINYHYECGYVYGQIDQLDSTIFYLKLTEKYCEEFNEVSIAANNYTGYMGYYYAVGDAKKSLQYATKAVKFYLKDKNLENAATTARSIGVILEMQGKSKEALQIYKVLEKYYLVKKRDVDMGDIYYCLAGVYKTLSQYNISLNYMLRSTEFRVKVKDERNLARNYDGIAVLMEYGDRYTEAIPYYSKAISLNKKLNAKYSLAGNYNKLTRCLMKANPDYKNNLKKIDKYEAFFKYALKLSNESEVPLQQAYSLASLGGLMLTKSDLNKGEKQKHLLEAEIYLKKAEAIQISHDLKSEYVVLCNYLIDLYERNNNNNLVEYYANKKLSLAKDIDNLYEIKQAAIVLKEFYLSQNNSKKAFEMAELVISANESIKEENIKNDYLKTEFNYETEKKEAAIKDLEHQNKIASLQAKQKTIVLYSIIGLAITIALITYFLFTRFKTKKQNELLKTKLEDAELLLIEKQKAADSEIKAIKSQMNPHFFYNALNSIQGYIYSGDKENAAKSLGLFSDLSRSVLESSRNTEISLYDEIELLENYLKLENMRLPKIKYTINASDNINLHDVYIPAMILQPLVENAVKHGLANKQGEGVLNIKFEENNNKLFIYIEDDGIGRAAAAEIGKRMIKKSASFSTEANISRIELLNANKTEKITQDIIDKKDKEGNAAGTIVKLVIPIELYD